MTPHLRMLVPATIALFACAACAGVSPSTDARPGLSARERHALAESFHWRPEQPTPRYDSAHLDALLRRSADLTLDGERAEAQTSALALALATVGDEAFSAALARQSEAVRQAVAHSGIAYLRTHYRLLYPRTQAILPPGA